MLRQPLLHQLLSAIAAPTQIWTDPTGQMTGTGVQGIFHSDVRVLRRSVISIAGEIPENISAHASGGTLHTITLARAADGPGADPTLTATHEVTVTPGVIANQLTLDSALEYDVDVHIAIELACDLATMETVKMGYSNADQPAEQLSDHQIQWSNGTVTSILDATTGHIDLTNPMVPTLRWVVTIPALGSTHITWQLTAEDTKAIVTGTNRPTDWTNVTVTADDPRLAALVRQSLADLNGLRMSHRETPHDTFLAAGAPWFFTLFGRDSLITARMLLPLGTEIAAGTLRTLAQLQGTIVDLNTAQQPGKILHEVRRESLELSDGTVLPPVYYGTVDATPLWITLLHDAWIWGMPDTEVQALIPNLQAALHWMKNYADADGDGFLEYIDESGRGLANQGWKDSGDSIQFIDGTLAVGPIALAEVQGYAYAAARAGAALLDAFGLDGGEEWRQWADRLAERFREAFWTSDADGPYPGIALDGRKHIVDIIASNMGHLLGTGILRPDEEAIVARRLVSPAMSSGYGLRTMATSSAGYWPLKYHGGSVWTHDTGIVIQGLAQCGYQQEAATLIQGLLAASEAFAYRMPELYSGAAAAEHPAAPYPAACRPQAWAAATSLAMVSALAGLTPHRSDDGSVHLAINPMSPSVVGALSVTGLTFRGEPVEVSCDAQGRLME